MKLNWKFWQRQNQPAQKDTKPAGRRQYDGALFNRLTADWFAQSTSFDSELRTSLRTLRNRSRQLIRDNDHARNVVRNVVNNVVGKGVGLQSQVKKKRGDALDVKTNKAIEAAYARWCRKQRCHTGGTLAFADIERLVMRAVVSDGEVLVRMITRRFADSAVPLALEIIEADQLAEEMNGRADNGNVIRMGVEVDEWQRPVAYWMYPHHPGDYQFPTTIQGAARFIRVPAAEIIHLHIQERPGATRGVPWLHSTLRRLHDMSGYQEAEIVAARAQAAVVGFIETPDADYDASDETINGDRVTSMEPGAIEQLAPGEKFTGFAPTRPGGQYEAFMRFMIRGMAAGVGQSYESLSKDYSQSNYSSSRLALLDDRDNWQILQQWLTENFHQVVYEKWLDMATLSGAVQLPGYETTPEAYTEALTWKTRGWAWIDPAKEIMAYEKAVRNGFATHADVVAQLGGDFDEAMAQRKREIDEYRRLGLVFDSDPSQVDAKGAVQSVPPTDSPDEGKVTAEETGGKGASSGDQAN